MFETVRMTLDHHFDIRTVTLGINLKDCIDRDLDWFARQVQARIVEKGQLLNHCADALEQKYGIPITNRRIAVTPVSLLLEPLPHKTITAVKFPRALDGAAKKANIDFLGGFGAMVQKGMTAAEENLIEAIPEALSGTERVCGFVNLASTAAGINMNAVVKVGHIIRDLAHRSSNGIGCAKLAVFANVPEDSPFMAGAHHGVGEPDFSLNIGISGPGVIRNVVAQNPDCDLTQLSEVIKRTVFKITRAGELIGRELAAMMKVDFGIVDISLAPTTVTGDSVAEIVEAMGVGRMGAPGTTTALALLIDAVKKGGAMASGNVGGLSGTFIPVSEDAGMIRAVRSGALSLDKLEALTSVCSVGLDMFAVPGDTPPETISSIIADELSIGVVNNKTTSVRIVPVPGAKPGGMVPFGGLLGSSGEARAALKRVEGTALRRKGQAPPRHGVRELAFPTIVPGQFLSFSNFF